MTIDPTQHPSSWLSEILVCPRDHLGLRNSGSNLTCPKGHSYPVVNGIPVLLIEEVDQTQSVASETLRELRQPASDDPYFVQTIGCNEDGKAQIQKLLSELPGESVDPVVQYIIADTNGILYRPLLGKLTEYPIPELPLPWRGNHYLLDIGCTWG